MTDLRSLFAGAVVSTYKNGIVTDDTKEVMRTEHNQLVGDSGAYDPETLKKMSMFWEEILMEKQIRFCQGLIQANNLITF